MLLNAIKFSEHNTDMPRVDIEAYYTPDTEMLQFSVIDFGIKISDADKPQLFQKFKTLESARRMNLVGSGLGLFICRSLVQAMGGTIICKNTLSPTVGVTAFISEVKAPIG